MDCPGETPEDLETPLHDIRVKAIEKLAQIVQQPLVAVAMLGLNILKGKPC